MAEDLQGLLKKIEEDGVKKVEAERETVLAKASEEAAKTVADAQAEADKLIADAKAESDKLQRAGEENLRQASRDVLIALEKEINAQLGQLAKAAAGQALSAEVMADIVKIMVQGYAQQGNEATSIEALAPADKLEALEGLIRAALGQQLEGGIQLRPITGVDAGLKVSLSGGSIYHDFTDEAIAEMISAYVNPRILAILKSGDAES